MSNTSIQTNVGISSFNYLRLFSETMIKSSMTRREQVSVLLIKGRNETKIAQELGVSRQTIVRDVSFLKKSSQSWLEGLAKDGFIFEDRLSLDKIKYHG